MEKVLIIDDDKGTLEVLGYLAKKSNIEVVLRSYIVPLTEIKEINPQLILLDHWVGGLKGSDLCLEIKEDAETRDTTVILLSAINEIGQVAMDSGADGSISKPFDIEEIEAIFTAYL